jgi:hypothetical protein
MHLKSLMYPKKGAVLEAQGERRIKERHVKLLAQSLNSWIDPKGSYKACRMSPAFEVIIKFFVYSNVHE